MTDQTRRARSGSGVRRARLVGGKRSGAGQTPRLKAGQAESPIAYINVEARPRDHPLPVLARGHTEGVVQDYCGLPDACRAKLLSGPLLPCERGEASRRRGRRVNTLNADGWALVESSAAREGDRALGIDLAGWTLNDATGISADGFTIVGNGVHNNHVEAWIATIPEPCSISLMLVGVAGLISRKRRAAGCRCGNP